MALSTDPQASTTSFLAWLQSAEGEAEQRPPRGAQRTFQFRFALATTELQADDRKRLLFFPAGVWILSCGIYVEDEIDTHGAPTLVWDLITETAAGAADTRKIITAAEAGRAAGEGVNMNAGGAVYVGERYLVFDPTTAAATAGAGEFVLTITLARGMATAGLPSIQMDAI